jgi:hypothetical protein
MLAISNTTRVDHNNWLFRGDGCADRITIDRHSDPLTKGFKVGVSDTPCVPGQPCPGELCEHRLRGRYHNFNRNFATETTFYIDCLGKRGRYVWLQLPGEKRILMPKVFSASKYGPTVPWTDDAKICYGAWARPFQALPIPVSRERIPGNRIIFFSLISGAFPEYSEERQKNSSRNDTTIGVVRSSGMTRQKNNNNKIRSLVVTTTDPRDPVYYSTCFMRERDIIWEDKPRTPPTLPRWDSHDSYLNSCGVRRFTKCVDTQFNTVNQF